MQSYSQKKLEFSSHEHDVTKHTKDLQVQVSTSGSQNYSNSYYVEVKYFREANTNFEVHFQY